MKFKIGNNEFGIGDNVNVTRLPGDQFNHSFTGHIKGSHGPYAIMVEDQDGDVWDCEPSQVSYSSDDIMGS